MYEFNVTSVALLHCNKGELAGLSIDANLSKFKCIIDIGQQDKHNLRFVQIRTLDFVQLVFLLLMLQSCCPLVQDSNTDLMELYRVFGL
jgi:hypothetical protein